MMGLHQTSVVVVVIPISHSRKMQTEVPQTMIAFTVLSKSKADAECPRGKMFVGSDGVKFVLEGSNGVFSGCVPWDLAPKCLAMLRVASEDEHTFEMHSMVNKKIESAGVDFDDVEHFVGAYGFEDMLVGRDCDSSSLLGSIASSWHLIERCPRASLHNELERVRQMSKDDLIEYAELVLR